MKNVIKVLIVVILIVIIALLGFAIYLESGNNKNVATIPSTYDKDTYNITNDVDENKIDNTIENIVKNDIDLTNDTNTSSSTNVVIEMDSSNEVDSNLVENTIDISINNDEENEDITEFNAKFDTTKTTLTSEEVKNLVIEINTLDKELLEQHSSHFVTISFLDVNGDRQSIAVDDNKMIYTSTDIKLSENNEYTVEYKDTDYDKYIDEIYIDKAE